MYLPSGLTKVLPRLANKDKQTIETMNNLMIAARPSNELDFVN